MVRSAALLLEDGRMLPVLQGSSRKEVKTPREAVSKEENQME